MTTLCVPGNVRGEDGYEHDERAVAKGQQLVSRFTVLPVTRMSRGTTFRALESPAFYSGQEKTAAREGLSRVGLAV